MPLAGLQARPASRTPARAIAVVGVLLFHLGLAGLLLDASTSRPRQAQPVSDAKRVAIRLLPPPALALLPAPVSPPSPDSTPSKPLPKPKERRPRQSTPTIEPRAPLEASVPNISAPPSAQAIAAPAPALPASAAPHAETSSLLDSDATRRAIRASARAVSLAERTAAASRAPAPRSAQDRMGASVAGTAKGDCLKGEYLGGGMGLLSLPFLAAAALREQCASR